MTCSTALAVVVGTWSLPLQLARAAYRSTWFVALALFVSLYLYGVSDFPYYSVCIRFAPRSLRPGAICTCGYASFTPHTTSSRSRAALSLSTISRDYKLHHLATVQQMTRRCPEQPARHSAAA